MKALFAGAILLLVACAGPGSSQPNGEPNTASQITTSTAQFATQATQPSGTLTQPSTTGTTSTTTVSLADTSTTANSTTTTSSPVTPSSPEPLDQEPVTTEPVTTVPVTTVPVTSEPATTEPVTTVPVTTEPVTTETIAPGTSPWPTDPRTTQDRTWHVQIADRWPHSTTAFTQGLELRDGTMYESTGLYGQSQLRALDGSTEIRSVALDPSLFGEGLTLVDDEIIQLTWQSGRALRWQRDTFEPIGEFAYNGEGWGICWDNLSQRLIMSDGTSTLTHRDSNNFAILSTVNVSRSNVDIARINELECVAGLVVANIWQTNQLIIIDPNNGEVLVTIDASLLANEVNIAAGETHAVLNGIAYQGNGKWVLGGKNWPSQFLVTFTLESSP